MLARIAAALLSTGVSRQTELMDGYLMQSSRQPGRKIGEHLAAFDENRDKLDSSLSLPGGGFINRNLHGFLAVEEAGLSKKEQETGMVCKGVKGTATVRPQRSSLLKIARLTRLAHAGLQGLTGLNNCLKEAR